MKNKGEYRCRERGRNGVRMRCGDPSVFGEASGESMSSLSFANIVGKCQDVSRVRIQKVDER